MQHAEKWDVLGQHLIHFKGYPKKWAYINGGAGNVVNKQIRPFVRYHVIREYRILVIHPSLPKADLLAQILRGIEALKVH